jgi:hypothetical protein
VRSIGLSGDTVSLAVSGGIGIVQFFAVVPAILSIDQLGECVEYGFLFLFSCLVKGENHSCEVSDGVCACLEMADGHASWECTHVRLAPVDCDARVSVPGRLAFAHSGCVVLCRVRVKFDGMSFALMIP